MATFLNASDKHGYAMRLAFAQFDPTAMPGSPAAGDEHWTGWVRPKGMSGTPGYLQDPTGRVVLSGFNGPEHLHQFVALYGGNCSEPDESVLPTLASGQPIYPLGPANNARLKPDVRNTLNPFWAARIHYRDFLSVDPDAGAVTWITKTFSQDEVDAYNWMMANVPGIDKSVTLEDLQKHAAGKNPGGANVTFDSRLIAKNLPQTRSTDDPPETKGQAVANLVFDTLLCMVGLGPLLKAEARSINAFRYAAWDEGFAYAELKEGETAEQALMRARQGWMDSQTSQFALVKAKWAVAGAIDRFEMLAGTVFNLGIAPARRIILSALSHLSLLDYLLYGTLALASLVSFFTPMGIVSASVGVLEFLVMIDILAIDVKNLIAVL